VLDVQAPPPPEDRQQEAQGQTRPSETMIGLPELRRKKLQKDNQNAPGQRPPEPAHAGSGGGAGLFFSDRFFCRIPSRSFSIAC